MWRLKEQFCEGYEKLIAGMTRVTYKLIFCPIKPPEFVSQGVLNELVEKFGLKLIGNAQEDMKTMLALGQ